MSPIGDRIKESRVRAGMTQEEIAKKMSTSITLVSRWENDKTEPRGSTRLKLARTLGVDPEWLRTGEGEMAQSPAVPQADETLEQLRWMFTQRDHATLVRMPSAEVAREMAMRPPVDVDKAHRDWLTYRISKLTADRVLQPGKLSAILEAAWAEGEGMGNAPSDEQILRYLDVAEA